MVDSMPCRSKAVMVSPGAIAARRQHTFSSSRTLPGQSCARSASSAGAAKRLAGASSLREAVARKFSASCGDVAATLAQRRQLQAHHVQPVQQVGTETAFGHQRLQVLVGCGDHAHVHPDQFAPADAEEFAFGQHPQQPGLQRQRHVADLVEEQGAAIGLLEAADMATLGAR